MAIVDTNCDPDLIDYVIPGNDDAIRSAALLTKVIARAAADGLMARSARAGGGDEKPEGPGAADEPLAEWERDLLPTGAGSDGASLTDPGPVDAPGAAASSAPVSTSNGRQRQLTRRERG